MRGAVLYRLGLEFGEPQVRELRLSYGTVMRIPFRPGYHPISRKEVDFEGNAICSDVMHWFAEKVLYQYYRS
jgi:hypothetical protein